MDLKISPPQRLGHLPLVLDTLRRTRFFDVIDHAIRDDPRSKVSTSECCAVILAAVFVGEHGLWRLRERLSPYDMQTIMRDAGFNLDEFPEERLAKALDDLFRADLDRLMSGVALQVIQQFDIQTDFLQFDTTSLSFYGAYESEEPGGMHGGIVPPKIVRGHSKARRPDLKQVVFGAVVSPDGGVPLWGKALDGNTNDCTAAAEFFGHIRSLVKDPREVCCVADSKGWTAANLALVHQAGMRLLSRLPRNTLLHRTILERTFQPSEVIERPLRNHGAEAETYEIQGFDEEETVTLTSENGSRQEVTIPVRAVRIYSSSLMRSKQQTLEKTHAKELIVAKRLIRDWQSRVYACRTDAERALQRSSTQHGLTTVDIVGTIERVEGPVKRRRGRPRKHPEPSLETSHFRINFTSQRAHHSTIAARLRRAATFVLIRTAEDGWTIPDAEMIERYKQQYHVEHGFSWLKSAAAINPMFVEMPRRVAALCFLYCIGLMTWTLIQRTVRNNLKEWGEGLPYHRNKPSDRITTRFLFELFAKVQTITFTDRQTGETRHEVLGTDKWTDLACRALGCPVSAFQPARKSGEF